MDVKYLRDRVFHNKQNYAVRVPIMNNVLNLLECHSKNTQQSNEQKVKVLN